MDNNGLVYQITSTGTYSTIYKFTQSGWLLAHLRPDTGSGRLFVHPGLPRRRLNFAAAIVKISTAGVLQGSYSFPCEAGGSFPIGPLVQAQMAISIALRRMAARKEKELFIRSPLALAATILHSFGSTFGDGEYPSAGLLLATDGNYYGSAAEGGTYDDGIFSTPLPAEPTPTLYSFNNSTNLMQMAPLSPAVQDTNGTLYGVTEFGGTKNDGTVYALNMGLPGFVDSPLFSGKRKQRA